MLRQLHISGLGVIEDLDLELDPGLNVLTGETGAGKTMIAVGLGLALGGRGSASLVRDGHRAAHVQARFDASAAAAEWAEDDEVILARSIGRDGRSTARIGGQLTTVTALADLGASVVEVHGQHQAARLTSTAIQTAFLDRFAGAAHLGEVAAYGDAYAERRTIGAELSAIRGSARERERELDLLAYQVREIEAVAPRAGESEELRLEEARLSHVERLIELAATADAAVAADGGAADLLASAASAAEAVADLDAVASGLAERLRGLAAEATELARDLRGYGASLQADPGRLQEVRERIGALRGLQRKYGATDEDVLAFLEDAGGRMAGLEVTDDRIEVLVARVAELDAVVERRARAVSAGRAAAAPDLSASLTRELAELGMPSAAVHVALEPAEPLGPEGAERASILLSPGDGQVPVPLAKAASGGELSRSMLAARSVLADLDEVPTLVFDEVDAGIGGEAGLAVGRRLARLAADRQVIVVTHLPQIASFADLHVRVRKRSGRATVEILDDGKRVHELSRMLAGLPGSESASSHAEELLAQAAASGGRSRR